VKSLSLVLALALLLLATTSAQAQVPYVQRELQIQRELQQAPLQRELQQAPQQRVIYNKNTPLLPPEEYDFPYAGQLKITIHTQDEIRVLCPSYQESAFKRQFPTIACNTRYGPTDFPQPAEGCWIKIATPKELRAVGTSWDVTLRHETAHCNGWPGTHPGSRPQSEALKTSQGQDHPSARPGIPAPSNVDAENECHVGTQVVLCSADYDPNYKSPPSPDPAPVRTRSIPTLKSSCQEYLDVRSNDVTWGWLEFLPLIGGYFGARSEGERIDLEKYMASFDGDDLVKYCTTNPERPFLDAVRSAYEAMVRREKGEKGEHGSAPQPPPSTQKRDAQVQVIEDLHLREQPDPRARNILGAPPNDKMPKGSQVAVIDTCRTWMDSGRGAQDADNIWCPVLYEGHRGWANAYYLADRGERFACVMYPTARGCASTNRR
jgi:hypothetical protein